MRKKLQVLLITFSIVVCNAYGQSYVTALGLRAGTELGVTMQQRLFRTNTLEGIATTNRYRWQVQTLLEHHKRFIGKRFNYYIGIGPHYGNEKGYGNY